MSTWASLVQARQLWEDATGLPDATLTMLLDSAQNVCEAYAPVLADPATPPANYTLAVVYTARLTRLGQSAAVDGDVLADGYTYTPPALTPIVKRMLRPDRGPMVG